MAVTTILDALVAHAAARPDAAALVSDDAEISWSALLDRVRTAAAAMAAHGAGSGERVALLMGTGPEAAIAYLGAVASGAAAVPFPMSLRDEGIAGLLADCAPCLIVADAQGHALCARLGDPGAPVAGMEALLSQTGGTDHFPLPADPAAPFNIIYSSGTTGTPKGIVQSHAMRDGQARRTAFGIGPASRMLLSTPIYSNTTLVPMLAALFHGGAVRLMEKFDTTRFLQLAQDWRATHTMLVPVQYQRIMDHPDFDRFDLSAMEVKQSTSAPFRPELKRDVLTRFPGKLYEVYGLTEGGVSTRLDASAHPDRSDTVGRPAPGVDLRVIDDEDRELPQGTVGEIVGHSDFMMTGYWNRPDLTEAFLWHAPDGRRFFRSGDLGRLDDEGFLHIVGRRKDMINSGGFNIYPVDLEAALATHPDVAECTVFAIPSRSWGETPFAAVVLRPGATAAAAEILDWANARLGRMQRIAGLDIRESLPRSSIGKVAKAELAEAYRDRDGAAT